MSRLRPVMNVLLKWFHIFFRRKLNSEVGDTERYKVVLQRQTELRKQLELIETDLDEQHRIMTELKDGLASVSLSCKDGSTQSKCSIGLLDARLTELESEPRQRNSSESSELATHGKHFFHLPEFLSYNMCMSI